MNTETRNGSQNPPARLALSTGVVLIGRAFGAVGREIVASGEVVFNTAMSGYQESLTDPSYTGQILVQTQPLIGNTGTNPEDTESARVQVAGFVIHEYTARWSNFRGRQSLDDYLRQAGVLGIAEVDTRALTRRLRSTGVVQGIVTDRADLSDAELVKLARQVESMAGKNLACAAGGAQDRDWTEHLGKWGGHTPAAAGEDAPVALVLDFGIKSNIARNLAQLGCRVRLVPQSVTAERIKQMALSGDADGLFLSNGPGDPQAVRETIDLLATLLDDDDLEDFPIHGICLGHQLLCLAMGARTYKLPFGHRGANHPVHELETGRIRITSQNHGFAVDEESLREIGGVITHVHLNDRTVAGFRHAHRPVAAVQFHPEASPGPHDAGIFFRQFVDRIKERRMGRTPA